MRRIPISSEQLRAIERERRLNLPGVEPTLRAMRFHQRRTIVEWSETLNAWLVSNGTATIAFAPDTDLNALLRANVERPGSIVSEAQAAEFAARRDRAAIACAPRPPVPRPTPKPSVDDLFADLFGDL